MYEMEKLDADEKKLEIQMLEAGGCTVILADSMLSQGILVPV